MMKIIARVLSYTTVNIVAMTTGPERFSLNLTAPMIASTSTAIDSATTPRILTLVEAEYMGLRLHASHAPKAPNKARAAVIMAYFGFSSVQLWLTGYTCPFGSY